MTRIRALTDVGNAERFLQHHAHKVRNVRERGWHVFDAKRWLYDPEAVTQLAINTAKLIASERDLTDDPLVREAIEKWCRASQSNTRIKAMIELAGTHASVLVGINDLDADGQLFNVLNGTYDLRKQELRDHSPSDLISKLAPIVFDKLAEAPDWLKFLARIFGDNDELISFVQRSCGSSLEAGNPDQNFTIAHGDGANGKTTVLETIAGTLGDYATHASADLFCERRGDRGIPNDIARLRGARFVAISETTQGRRLDENMIKQLTGDDTIAARFLHQEFFEYRPVFKPWLASNHKPAVRGTDHGIWRRLKLVPFEVQIPEAEQDKRLVETLKKEASGVLNWLLAGHRAWKLHGLNPPTAVRLATESYRAESDVLGEFLTEKCVADPEAKQQSATELWGIYKAYCEEGNEKAASQTQFGKMLADRGFKKHKSDGIKYLGLRKRTAQDDADDAEKVSKAVDGILHECRNLGIELRLIDGGTFDIIGNGPPRLDREIEQYSVQILERLSKRAA